MWNTLEHTHTHNGIDWKSMNFNSTKKGNEGIRVSIESEYEGVNI